MDKPNKVKRLTLKAWYKIADKADGRYSEEVLGGKPTRGSISKKNPNRNGINVMEWAALILMGFLMFFAGFKVWPTAAAYATQFFNGADAAKLPLIAGEFFMWATIFVLALMNTVGFVFFKLQTEDEEILAKQASNPIKWHKVRTDFGTFSVPYNILAINVWSPRMYEALTYLVLIWQIAIAITGIHHYEQPIEWLNAALPVFSEIAMATLISTVLRKVRERSIEIDKLYRAQADEFNSRYEVRHNDERYLTIVFQELREKLVAMNAHLEMLNSEKMREFVLSEYDRLTAGIDFARDVFKLRKQREGIATEIVGESAEAQAVHDGKRRPPNGALAWTVDTLINDFRARNIMPDTEYTEAHLMRDYAEGYGWRPAWRGNKEKQGARVYFSVNRK